MQYAKQIPSLVKRNQVRRTEQGKYLKQEEIGSGALEISKMLIKIDLRDSNPGNKFQRSLESFCETSG